MTTPTPQQPAPGTVDATVAVVGYEEDVPADSLTPYRQNPRQGDIGAIAESLQQHGQYRPIVANVGTHASVRREVLAGNHTLQAALHLGWPSVAVTWVDVDDDTAARIVLIDNRTNDLATYDDTELADLLGVLAASPSGLTGTGFSDDSYERLLARLRYGDVTAAGSLQQRYVVPPFSVLDGRQGYWRTRKQHWLDLGIRGEEGRAHLGVTVDAGGTLTLARGRTDTDTHTGGSIFDPVLAELAVRWYCPPAGHVYDPFAGGTTRGAVAGALGHPYTGIELRPEQVEANQAQAASLDLPQQPTWLQGDSAQLPQPGDRLPRKGTWQRHVNDTAPFDLLLTCPPYFNLEPYSQDQLDGSSLPDWPDFTTWYRDVFARATAVIAPNRFAVVVVGEVRDRRTHGYVNLVGLTVDTFLELGWHYFAEYTYITPIGSLAIRTGAQFPTSRKPGKGHQNLLVFYNGDPRTIRDTWPQLDSVHTGDLPGAPDPDAID